MAKLRKHGDKARITLTDPRELLAALPSMLGFGPADSVIALALGSDLKRIRKTLRADLPPPEAVADAARVIAESIGQDRPPAVLLAVVGGGEPAEDGPPQAMLIRTLKGELAERGISVPEAYWIAKTAADAAWTCYSGCCKGVLPDPASSLLAAELTAMGHVTFESRADLERLFTPDDQALLDLRADVIDEKVDSLRDGWPLEDAVGAVRAALRASATGVLALGDEQIAELSIALTDPMIRDACLATAVPPDTALAGSAARLWQALTRALPAPERADAASLAAFAAYQAGDGALAGIALDVALQADPVHVLAGLLDRALKHGMHPRQLRQLGEHDEVGLCAQLRTAA